MTSTEGIDRLDLDPQEANAPWDEEASEILKVWLMPVNFQEVTGWL